MKVGDLVQISVEAIMSGEAQETVEGYGIVVGKRGLHIMQILWDDGLLEEQHENDLALISEALEQEVNELAMSFAD